MNNRKIKVDCQRFVLVAYSSADLLELVEGYDQFAASFGKEAAKGLREFIVSDDVSPQYIDWLRNNEGSDPWVHGFAVVEKQSDLVIGTGGYKGAPDQDGVVEIAYGIVPDFEGRGFATDLTAELINFATRDPNARKILAHTLPDANASTRVLKKNQFAFVEEVQDPQDGLVWRWEWNPAIEQA